MILLRHFIPEDYSVIQKYQYPELDKADILKMISDWNTFCYHNQYFERFAIELNGTAIGSISLYQQGIDVISTGIEIFMPYRKCGYALESMELILKYARQKGYRKIINQVRQDNTASIELHKKLGYFIDREEINSKGHKVYIFIKIL